ncbi:hypothetical protein BLOT_007602 [Blomia tropicalis]|nr:hypothetical protein BLOT_007602 [Blomia tropicalis]
MLRLSSELKLSYVMEQFKAKLEKDRLKENQMDFQGNLFRFGVANHICSHRFGLLLKVVFFQLKLAKVKVENSDDVLVLKEILVILESSQPNSTKTMNLWIRFVDVVVQETRGRCSGVIRFDYYNCSLLKY